MNRLITLTTDFGLKDPYQGAMKGAILSVNPEARVVDITHLVAPGNITEGAFILLGACGYFPERTIHVGVVDPGVGGERKPILIETERYFFVGPDNGLFSLIARNEKIKRAIELKNTDYFLESVSSTFHGRDIFGPVAAHLSMGVEPRLFGPELKKIMALEDLPKPEKEDGLIKGEVIYIDSFGNLITNIRKEDIMAYHASGIEVSIRDHTMKGLKKTYSLVDKGSPVALLSSSDHLEIAVNSGMAAQVLRAKVGDSVVFKAQRQV